MPANGRIISHLARVYTQTNYQIDYLSFAQVRQDGLYVSSINRANDSNEFTFRGYVASFDRLFLDELSLTPAVV